MINEERFINAISKVSMKQSREGIGTLAEKPLHRILKYYVEPDSSRHEVKLLGSVVDVFNEDGVFEIQTSSFFPLVKKLKKLLLHYKVTIVRPIIAAKTVVWLNKEDREVLETRKSPKKRGFTDILPELSSLGEIFPDDNLTVKLLLLSAEEYKYLDGYGNTKKKRATKLFLLPHRIISEVDIKSIGDILAILPNLQSPFSSKDFSKAFGLRARHSYYALKFLVERGVVKKIGKEKNAFLYEMKNEY